MDGFSVFSLPWRGGHGFSRYLRSTRPPPLRRSSTSRNRSAYRVLATAGNVVFAEIMLLPNGMSKGCGCVSVFCTLVVVSMSVYR